MLTTKSLTGGELEGAGIFEEMMRTVKSHIQSQLDSGYITERAYAEMYLGAMNHAMSVSTDYLLKMQTVNQQTELLKEQVEQAKKQSLLLDLQRDELQLRNDTAEYNLANILPKQAVLLTSQNDQVLAQITLSERQLDKLTAEISVIGKQEDLLDKQILTETANTTTPTAGLSLASYNKSLAETALLSQKKETETAQTEGTADTVGGLVGAEMELKNLQRDSFKRDAEQKAAKMYVDIAATAYATDPDNSNNYPSEYGLSGTTSKAVLQKLLEGVDVTTVIP